MKKPPQVALLCTGSLAASPISRLPGFATYLGPVKSTSLRLASRYVNSLRAGFPVDDFGAIQQSEIVLIACPDAAAVEMIEMLSNAALDWRGKCVAVCSDQLESDALSRLADAGANTASVGTVDGVDALLVEGDRTAVVQLRPVLRAGTGTKLLLTPPGRKKFYLAASACTGPMLTALLGRASECLKLSGLSAPEAAELIEMQARRTTRAFLKAGKKGSAQPDHLERHAAALRLQNPDLADFFERAAILTQRIAASKHRQRHQF